MNQRSMAFSILLGVPLTVTGCADAPPPPPQPTAYDECQWDRDRTGQWEIDCGNENEEWYEDHHYSSKGSAVSTNSAYYQYHLSQAKARAASGKSPAVRGGVGSGGKTSGGFSTGG